MGFKGKKKHLKRFCAPTTWMLSKTGGVFAPRPVDGPHPMKLCLPLIIFLRNKLKYALTGHEVMQILYQRVVKVDGRIITEPRFPSGLMDVISIERTGEYFRLLHDVKGHYVVHRITPEEAEYKLCRVTLKKVGSGGIPYIMTHDNRTLRFVDPIIKVTDTIQLNLMTQEIMDVIHLVPGNVCYIHGGSNLGRVGVMMSRDKNLGKADVVYLKDANGQTFATRVNNVFVIGKGNKPYISLPKTKGVKLTIMEEREKRLAALNKV